MVLIWLVGWLKLSCLYPESPLAVRLAGCGVITVSVCIRHVAAVYAGRFLSPSLLRCSFALIPLRLAVPRLRLKLSKNVLQHP